MSRKSLVPIELPGNPTNPLEAVPKQYVDSLLGSGSDEVFIGPSDPGATYELWYDTDAPSSVAVGGNRNLLNNGQMAVNQRGLSVLAAHTGGYLADRHYIQNFGIGVCSLTYSTTTAFGVAPPAGRPRPGNTQYIQMTTAEAAGAVAAADYMRWQHAIEGQNLQHLAWGTADAQPLTLSFDCYSTVAATYVAELYRTEASGNRHVGQTFSVAAGYSTVVLTFPGDLTTLITNDNAARLYVFVFVGAGSNLTSTPLSPTWRGFVTTGEATGVTNSLAATINNVFALTNMQLEVGSIATPYGVKSYAEELRDCQRYFERLDSSVEGSYVCFASGQSTGTAGARYMVPWKVPKRAIPTVTYSAASTFGVLGAGGNVIAGTAVSTRGASRLGVDIDVAVASGTAAGQASLLYSNNVTTTTIDGSAEI